MKLLCKLECYPTYLCWWIFLSGSQGTLLTDQSPNRKNFYSGKFQEKRIRAKEGEWPPGHSMLAVVTPMDHPCLALDVSLE